jgi:hypothetical protein
MATLCGGRSCICKVINGSKDDVTGIQVGLLLALHEKCQCRGFRHEKSSVFKTSVTRLIITYMCSVIRLTTRC